MAKQLQRSSRVVVAVMAACGLLFGAAACGAVGGSGSASAAAATPNEPLPTRPPHPASQCGGPSGTAQTFWLDLPNGDKLQSAAIRDGSDVVIFVHESGRSGLCGFWPYANWLAQTDHVTALLVDMCGYGSSRCAEGKHDDTSWVDAVTAMVQRARSRGAARVSLVGASFGGIVALNAATAAGVNVDSVVDLSGEMSYGGLNSASAAGRLYVPTLYAVAPQDSHVRAADMRSLLKRTTASRKQLVVAPQGAGHGWDMLSGGDGGWSKLAHTVADWVAS
jgi:predicted esterase